MRSLPSDGEWIGVGDGFRVLEGALIQRLGARLTAVHPELSAGAAQVARLASWTLAAGGAQPATDAVPRYLRDSVAQTKAERSAAASKSRR